MRSANPFDVRPDDLTVDVPSAARPADDRLAALVERMHQHAEDFVDRAVRRITNTVDSYDRPETATRDDLSWSVYRRAQQGMTVDDVMRAFRVGYTVLWEGLSQIAGQLGPEYAQTLLEHAAHVWMTFDQVTSSVAEAHRETIETRHIDRRRRALRFLNGLQTYPQDALATEELARALGIDPQGPFTIAVHAPGAQAPLAGRDVLSIDQPDRVVVLSMCSGEPRRPARGPGRARGPGAGKRPGPVHHTRRVHRGRRQPRLRRQGVVRPRQHRRVPVAAVRTTDRHRSANGDWDGADAAGFDVLPAGQPPGRGIRPLTGGRDARLSLHGGF